jgi:hypothetical protein
VLISSFMGAETGKGNLQERQWGRGSGYSANTDGKGAGDGAE